MRLHGIGNIYGSHMLIANAHNLCWMRQQGYSEAAAVSHRVVDSPMMPCRTTAPESRLIDEAKSTLRTTYRNTWKKADLTW